MLRSYALHALRARSPDRRMTSWRNNLCVRIGAACRIRICGHRNKGNGLAWANQHTCGVRRNRTLGLIVGGSGRLRDDGDTPQHQMLAFGGMTSWNLRAHYWLEFD